MRSPAAPIPRIRASVVCRRRDELLTVRAADPVTGLQYLFLPGGEIEAAESPAAAAVRETLEETGYAVTIHGQPIVADYQFDWSGKTYDCRTFFFAARLNDSNSKPAAVNDAAFLLGVEWVAISQSDQAFGYHPMILNAVRELVQA